jgi:hypothetical protein
MPRRVFWTAVGYGAGIASTVMVKRRVRRTVNRYAPSEVRSVVSARGSDVVDRAKRVSTEIRAAADEGLRAMRVRRRELDDEFALPSDIRASDLSDPDRIGNR